MKSMFRYCLTLCFVLASSSLVFGHAHTHIGRNQDQAWGTDDDNTLWFFSMPGTDGWPNWGDPLPLVYQEAGPLAGYWVCEALDCWHSAHPDHGNWQLGDDAPLTEPDWEAGIERVSFSDGFFMADEESISPVLQNDGDQYVFDHLWMEDKYNENGTPGSWGFHQHLLFCADAVGPGEYFTASFRAVDVGDTGYGASETYTMTFVTVPEPVSMLLLTVGGAALFRRRHKAFKNMV